MTIYDVIPIHSIDPTGAVLVSVSKPFYRDPNYCLDDASLV
jgi:hypothetical protein